MNIRKVSDRSYEIAPEDIGELRRLFDTLGATHFAGRADSLYTHRWMLTTAGGRSVCSLFSSNRLTVLGPTIEAVDELCEVAI